MATDRIWKIKNPIRAATASPPITPPIIRPMGLLDDLVAVGVGV